MLENGKPKIFVFFSLNLIKTFQANIFVRFHFEVNFFHKAYHPHNFLQQRKQHKTFNISNRKYFPILCWYKPIRFTRI